MDPSRLEILQNMSAAHPEDPFLRYGIAQEYVKLGDFARAVETFEDLGARNPEYLATYYHLGQAYRQLDRPEDARRTYRAGIEVATRNGDRHARSELCEALDLLDGA